VGMSILVLTMIFNPSKTLGIGLLSPGLRARNSGCVRRAVDSMQLLPRRLRFPEIERRRGTIQIEKLALLRSHAAPDGLDPEQDPEGNFPFDPASAAFEVATEEEEEEGSSGVDMDDFFSGPWAEDFDEMAERSYVAGLTEADVENLFAEAQDMKNEWDKTWRDKIVDGMHWWDERVDGPAEEGKSGIVDYDAGTPFESGHDYVEEAFELAQKPGQRVSDLMAKHDEDLRKQGKKQLTEEELNHIWEQMAPGRVYGMEPANEGDSIPPETKLYFIDEVTGALNHTNTSQLFRGQTWALFGIHGAFHANCEQHLEAIREWTPYMAKNGMNIGVVSTNDAFTLTAWKDQLNWDHRIKVLSDANGELAACLGLLNDTPLGMRNDRYSVLTHEGKIFHLRYEDPADEIVETLPGPVVQTYKKFAVALMNETAEMLHTITDMNEVISAYEYENWHAEKQRLRISNRFRQIKQREEASQGSGNMRMVKTKKKDKKLPGWSPPEDDKNDKLPHEVLLNKKDPRLPTKYRDSVPHYPHDDEKDWNS